MRKLRDRSNPKTSVISYIKCNECGKMLYKDEIHDSKYCKDCAEMIRTAKELSYHKCLHCNQYYPEEKIKYIQKLIYCKECASKAINCKYCGMKFIPNNKEIVCPFCFESKSKICQACGAKFIPDKTHHHICNSCFKIKGESTQKKDYLKTSQISETNLETLDIDSLIKLFNNDNYSDAIRILSIKGYDAVDPLIDCLEDDKKIRNCAIKTLTLIGQPAVESLIEGLEFINDDQRRGCVEALGIIGDETAIEPLIEIFENDYDQRVKITAAHALGHFKSELALSSLINYLSNEENPKIRATCALAIGDIRNENGLSVLQETLFDENKSVSKASTVSIIKIRDEQYLQDLINNHNPLSSNINLSNDLDFNNYFVKFENTELKDKLIELTKNYDTKSDSFIKEIVELFDENVSIDDKIILIDILGNIPNPISMNYIIDLLKDEDMRIRWSAKESLEKQGKYNLNELIKFLNSDEDDIRYVIVFILTEMDDERVIEPLISSLYDSDSDIRFKAFKYLSNSDDERIIPHINNLIDDEDVNIRLKAIKLLSKKGDENSLEYLHNAVSDEDKKIKINANNAIIEIRKRLGIKIRHKKRKRKIKKYNVEISAENSIKVDKNPMKLLNDLRK